MIFFSLAHEKGLTKLLALRNKKDVKGHIDISPSFENLLKIRSDMTVKTMRIVERAQALPSAPFATIA